MGRVVEAVAPSRSTRTDGGYPVAQVNDLSRSLTTFDPISTLVMVVEMSRMRESRTYGSVRGALSNERPYRDPKAKPIEPGHDGVSLRAQPILCGSDAADSRPRDRLAFPARSRSGTRRNFLPGNAQEP